MVFECKVATIWSIKKETFNYLRHDVLYTEKIQTTIDGYDYCFKIDEHKGDVAIFISAEGGLTNRNNKLTLTIPSANFEGDLSTDAEVPEGHFFHGYSHTVVIKQEDILNPDKKYFVDDILTLEFRGIIEFAEKPKPSLSEMLWESEEDKDFTFIIGTGKIKAHKLVLRQYSSVFAKLIDSNIHQIEEEEYDCNNVNDILQLCYDTPWEEGGDLYHKLIVCLNYAHDYNMPLIKEQIGHRLSDYIFSWNVCELANKSIELQCPTLKGYCVSFISKCKEDGTPYDGALDLKTEIMQEVDKLSVCDTLNS